MKEKVYLPLQLQEKLTLFPEYHMGAHRVAVLLLDGRMFENVIVAWESELISVGGERVIPFNGEDIIDVYDRSKE